jgi:hypothetical protein
VKDFLDKDESSAKTPREETIPVGKGITHVVEEKPEDKTNNLHPLAEKVVSNITSKIEKTDLNAEKAEVVEDKSIKNEEKGMKIEISHDEEQQIDYSDEDEEEDEHEDEHKKIEDKLEDKI